MEAIPQFFRNGDLLKFNGGPDITLPTNEEINTTYRLYWIFDNQT